VTDNGLQGTREPTKIFRPDVLRLLAFVVGVAVIAGILLLFVRSAFGEGGWFSKAGVTVTLDFRALGIIAMLTVVDLAAKHNVYKDLPSVQSVSVDVVILSLGYRLATSLADIFLNQSNSTVLGLDFIAVLFLFLCIFFSRYIYREQFVDAYRNLLKTALRGPLAGVPADQKECLEKLLLGFKHPDLWGVFGGNEFEDMNGIIEAVGGKQDALSQAQLQLPWWRRAYIVSALAAVASVALLLNGIRV
jgi:hypothetical protein